MISHTEVWKKNSSTREEKRWKKNPQGIWQPVNTWNEQQYKNGHMVLIPPGTDTALVRQSLTVSSCQKGCESKLGLNPLLRVLTLVRFQFCTCYFQPLLLNYYQNFPENGKNLKPSSLLHKLLCLLFTLFLFARVCSAVYSLPLLKMLCLELLLPWPIPGHRIHHLTFFFSLTYLNDWI